ncbi:MAG: hypothetical protein JKY03_02275, partial [Aureispira sp.]|nr:hypothetical protein [Aureispira sp.]
ELANSKSKNILDAFNYGKIQAKFKNKSEGLAFSILNNQPHLNEVGKDIPININGTWFGEYLSIDSKGIEYKGEIALIIHYTDKSIEIISRTEKYMAHSFSESFIYNKKNKNRKLIYLYSQNGFDIHNDIIRKGASDLELFFENNSPKLLGDFWTNSPSKGRLIVIKISDKHLNSFTEAQKINAEKSN